MSNLAPDTAQFLAWFHGQRTFRTLDDRPEQDPTLAHTLYDPDLQALLDLSQRRAGVHLMINAGDGIGHKFHNVTEVRAFGVTVNGSKREQVLQTAFSLSPSGIVEVSPDHHDLYWLLQSGSEFPLDSERYAAQQEAIAQAVGGQTFICSGLNVAMRVPGFQNWQHHSRPFMSLLLSPASGTVPQTYTVEQIEAAFPLADGRLRSTAPLMVGGSMTRFGSHTPRQRDYARRVLNHEYDLVQRSLGAKREPALQHASQRLGQLVASGYLPEATVVTSLTAAGLACGLPTPDVAQAIRLGITAALARPANLSHLTAPVRPVSRGQVSTADSARLAELLDQGGAEAWRDEQGGAYLTLPFRDHWEHYRLDDHAVRSRLEHLLYLRDRATIRKNALSEVIAHLQASALYDGRVHPTGVRTVHVHGRTYLDLGNEDWEVVEVEAGAWRVITPEESPVRFTRPAGQLPLPVPTRGGDLTLLRRFININEGGFMLCTAWLLAAVSGRPPYPLLCLHGEQGAGKSVASSVLQRLVDPHRGERRWLPSGAEALFHSAQHAHVLAFDNVSRLTAAVSDTLCTLSTGGAYARRALYQDRQETVLEAVRPVLLNGIPDLVTRPDLASRALTITLQPMSADERQPERELWDAFEEARPLLLGALLTALASGLSRVATMQVEHAPRMIDFARLVAAAEAELPWPPGAFMAQYHEMRAEVDAEVLREDEVARAITDLLDETYEWTGTVGALLTILTSRAFPSGRSSATWPRTARALGEALRRLSPPLRTHGYNVQALNRGAGGRRYCLTRS